VIATRKTWLKLGLGLLVAVCLVGLAAFLFPQEILSIDSGDVRGDIIVLLGGGAGERPARAAELFHSGAASTILISGAGDTDGNRLLLRKHGVPQEAIQIEPDSKTTKENALFSIPLLQKLGAKQVIIVTSWYHSRRALHCFRHYAPGIQFYSRPSYFAYRRSDWSRDHTARRIRAEYTKLVWYWFRFGVSPL